MFICFKLLLVLLCSTVCCHTSFVGPLRALKREGIQAFLIDFDTGCVLFGYDQDVLMFPSSMQKSLLLYTVFEYMQGRDPKSVQFAVSDHAYKQEGSRLFLEKGSIDVETLITGTIVSSGNDAAVALAEGMYGTEEDAAHAMEMIAKEMGCSSTTVRNASGLHNPAQMTTPHDLAQIGCKLIEKFPEEYWRFSQDIFTHNKIKQINRNTALELKSLGVDGIKSGRTDAAGYGLLFSAQKDGRRLVGVVNGCRSNKETKEMTEKMLTYGFENFQNIRLCHKGDVIVNDAEVWMGSADTVNLVAAQDYMITIPKALKDKVAIDVVYNSPIKAPFDRHKVVGHIRVKWPSGEENFYPLVAEQEVQKKSFWKRPWSLLCHWVKCLL
ncbi:MAG: D-alanyl-D-alanine carboxypeptidase [Alphaproteobacteria bacterium]|nr:D-alanyl-D-alanine carboxypeptidase [Alphaproteobacteria bacterium]